MGIAATGEFQLQPVQWQATGADSQVPYRGQVLWCNGTLRLLLRYLGFFVKARTSGTSYDMGSGLVAYLPPEKKVWKKRGIS